MAAVSRDPDTALPVHACEELGVDPFGLSGRSWGLSSLVAFSLGALMPLLPNLAGLPVLRSDLRQFAPGAVTVGVTFTVGSLIGGHVT
jgi:vacuolar iron transporter family protein